MTDPSFNYKQLSFLHQNLVAYFSIEDLRTLCFKMGFDYDNLPGEGKVSKARELVIYIAHRGRVVEFIEICQRFRPNVSWEIEEFTSRTSHSAILDEKFSEATSHYLMGDLGYSLQLYRQLKEIAPTYPRIDATITEVEKEMQSHYVDRHGRVVANSLFRMPAQKMTRTTKQYGYVTKYLKIIALIIVIVVIVLIYLWLKNTGIL